MIHIKYKLDKSEHHGIGLFAGEDLSAGQLVYTASPMLDVNLTQGQFDTLSNTEKEEIKWWGYFNESTKRWHVDFDVSKFINHSLEGNLTQGKSYEGAYLITLRDIKRGEELTQNYLEFESAEEFKERNILN